MFDLLVASNNQHKIKEYQEMFFGYDVKVHSPKELGINANPDETGTTYEENSLIKAKALHTRYHLRERLTTFERGGDVEETQFVSPLLTIGFAQFYGVARTSQIHEVRALDGLAVLDIQTGYYAFCQSHSSFRLIFPS